MIADLPVKWDTLARRVTPVPPGSLAFPARRVPLGTPAQKASPALVVRPEFRDEMAILAEMACPAFQVSRVIVDLKVRWDQLAKKAIAAPLASLVMTAFLALPVCGVFQGHQASQARRVLPATLASEAPQARKVYRASPVLGDVMGPKENLAFLG